jgi:hypothetical protein
MRFHKHKKAAFLFSEMGGIDDYLLQEALIYRPVQKRTSRLLIMVACLAMSAVLVLGGVVIGNLAGIKNDAPPANEDLQPTPADDSLDGFLAAHGNELAYVALDTADEVDLFAAPAVVWQSAESDELLISRPLTEGELKKLTDRAKGGTAVGEVSPAQSYRVWILSGDGTVTSPYLKPSAGNVGTELFDYEAEVIPSSAFTSCLEEILRS